MMDIDYYFGDDACPKCGHSPTRYRDCDQCEDGFIDLYDEDPLWYDEDETELCNECWGTGIQSWCPKCGCDIQRWYHEHQERQIEDDTQNITKLGQACIIVAIFGGLILLACLRYASLGL